MLNYIYKILGDVSICFCFLFLIYLVFSSKSNIIKYPLNYILRTVVKLCMLFSVLYLIYWLLGGRTPSREDYKYSCAFSACYFYSYNGLELSNGMEEFIIYKKLIGQVEEWSTFDDNFNRIHYKIFDNLTPRYLKDIEDIENYVEFIDFTDAHILLNKIIKEGRVVICKTKFLKKNKETLLYLNVDLKEKHSKGKKNKEGVIKYLINDHIFYTCTNLKDNQGHYEYLANEKLKEQSKKTNKTKIKDKTNE